jgi:hypothetical protein
VQFPWFKACFETTAFFAAKNSLRTYVFVFSASQRKKIAPGFTLPAEARFSALSASAAV